MWSRGGGRGCGLVRFSVVGCRFSIFGSDESRRSARTRHTRQASKPSQELGIAWRARVRVRVAAATSRRWKAHWRQAKRSSWIVSSDRLFLYCLINHTGSISGVICCISCMDVMRTMAEQSSAEQCGTGARRDVRGRGRGRGARRKASSKASVASDNAKLERPGSGRASTWRARSVQRAGRVASRVHAMLVGSPHMGGRIVLPLLATPDASPLDADRICDGQPDLVEVTPCGKRGNASS
jgi:hypothetical protein